MSCFNLKPFSLNWPTITAEDTFPGFEIAGQDAADGDTLERVRMQVRNSAGAVAYEADSDDTGVEILNANTWHMSFDEFDAPATAGNYFYDIETTGSQSGRATIISGIWTILAQVTQEPEA
jgi:hypothetical protein